MRDGRTSWRGRPLNGFLIRKRRSDTSQKRHRIELAAHNVIGALWEVSDESTPQLMGDLYQDIGQGMPPSSALRHAKLAMMRSHKEFSKPFYWAPLQIYTGR